MKKLILSEAIGNHLTTFGKAKRANDKSKTTMVDCAQELHKLKVPSTHLAMIGRTDEERAKSVNTSGEEYMQEAKRYIAKGILTAKEHKMYCNPADLYTGTPQAKERRKLSATVEKCRGRLYNMLHALEVADLPEEEQRVALQVKAIDKLKESIRQLSKKSEDVFNEAYKAEASQHINALLNLVVKFAKESK